MRRLTAILCLTLALLLGSAGVSFALPSCPVERHPTNSPWSNCFGTYTYASGNKYVGEFRDGTKNGQGTYTFVSGNKYAGEFRDGKYHGQGTYTHADGNKYVGEFRDGKYHGHFTVTYADGNKYVGEFRDGKKNGQGTYTHADRRIQDGIFKDGEFQYAQKVIECDGSPLTGSNSGFAGWDDCEGTYTFASGDKYVGEFRGGLPNGQGTYTWSNGDKYVGEYRNGKRNGQGTYTHTDGNKYVGEFRDGKKNGQGTYTHTDGNEYVGEYRNGKKHGQGTYTYTNGRIKEGIWKDNKLQYAQNVTPLVVARKSPSANLKRRTDPNKVISASSGSGFAVSSQGHVITNHHVIKGCNKVKIHHDGRSISARVITFDPRNDLALLKGDFRPSTILPLSTKSPELLQDVYVAGYPFGRNFSTGVKVTKGIISSLTGMRNNYSNIQIDAALQPGNSGSPILNDRGNVIGVAVARLDKIKTLKNLGSLPENTNFGIKTSVVRNILKSNNVSLPSPNRSSISKTRLGKMISDGTYYLSCWMTMAQIEKLRSKKVIFQNLD